MECGDVSVRWSVLVVGMQLLQIGGIRGIGGELVM